jgi:UDP-3-O-[3-hydroxymyristoyl] glucosamine N-acyltransferase
MPFQTHAEWLKTAASLRHLSEMNERIKLLEKKIEQLQQK